MLALLTQLVDRYAVRLNLDDTLSLLFSKLVLTAQLMYATPAGLHSHNRGAFSEPSASNAKGAEPM